MATQLGQTAIVKRMLEEGVDPNVRGEMQGTSLHAVTRYGGLNAQSGPIAALLLSDGADPNLSDSFGVTPLHLAAQWNNAGLVKLLLDYGADPTLADNQGRTPRDLAKRRPTWGLLHEASSAAPASDRSDAKSEE